MPFKTAVNKLILDNLPESLRQKSVVLPVLVIFVTIVLLLLMRALQPEPIVIAQKEKTWVVNTRVLMDSEKSPQIKMFAQVESPYSSVLSAAINADVQSLYVREGQAVTVGQQLVMLDDVDVQIAVEQGIANNAEINASIVLENNRYKNDLMALKLEKSLVSLAEKKLAREKKTSKTNLTSQSSLDLQKQALYQQKLSLEKNQLNVKNHTARLSQLEAQQLRSQALLRQAELDVKRAMIIAPFDGVVLSTDVSPGERVRAGEPLLEIYATHDVELRAQLPQKYISVVKKSLHDGVVLQASINQVGINADLVNFPIELDRLSGAVANSGSGIDALFKVPQQWMNAFTIGETVELTLNLPAVSDVFSVPVSAIYGTNRIYRVVDNRLQAINVEVIGNRFVQGRQQVLVKSKRLNAGDEIITTQLPHAINGLSVETNQPADSTKSTIVDANDVVSNIKSKQLSQH